MRTESVYYRIPAENELEAVSTQLNQSYCSAYRGLMTDEYLSSLEDGHWLPILRRSLADGGTCIVAEQNGGIIGTAVFGVEESDSASPKRALLHAIYLSPSLIGQGVGHGLYAEAEKSMRTQGCQSCILEVLSENSRAIRFYSAHGFVKTGAFAVRENGMSLRCDIMEKELGRTSPGKG